MEWLRLAPALAAPISVDAVEAKLRQSTGSPKEASAAAAEAE